MILIIQTGLKVLMQILSATINERDFRFFFCAIRHDIERISGSVRYTKYLLIQVPLLIRMVAGDVIAGEANMGTLRLVGNKTGEQNGTECWQNCSIRSFFYCLIIDMDGIACFILKHAFFGTNDMLIARNDVMEQISRRNTFYGAISQLLDMRQLR